jgi:predicted CoA-binding protein
MSKKTLIIGATDNPERYAYRAAERLITKGHEIVPVGIKKVEIFGRQIITDKNKIFNDIDTITLYISVAHQKEWYDYLLKTHPKRVIFNPGTENQELAALLTHNGIEVVEGCTLVMLANGLY